MDLRIRSQDRERLFKIDKLGIEEAEGFLVVLYTDKYEWYRLGNYKTKERALEVLDEIQEAQLGNYHYGCPSNVKVSNNENTIVYEMPEK